MGILRPSIRGEFRPPRPGDRSLHFSTPHERFSFEISATLQYRLSSPVVYVIGREVAKRFVIADPVIVTDKPTDLFAQIVRIVPDEEVDLLLAGPMLAFHLAIGDCPGIMSHMLS